MSITVRNCHPLFRFNRHHFQRQAECMLNSFREGKFHNKDAIVFFVTNTRMRYLAAKYADEPKTTDVLSIRVDDDVPLKNIKRHPQANAVSWDVVFKHMQSQQTKFQQHNDQSHKHTTATTIDNNNNSNIETLPFEIGYVYIAPDYCNRVAKRRNIPPHHYLTIATVHGLAHLANYDHETHSQYQEMKRAEQIALRAVRDLDLREYGETFVENMPTSYLR